MNFSVGLRVLHTVLPLKNGEGKDSDEREQLSYGLGTVIKIQTRNAFLDLITVKFDGGGTHRFSDDTERLTEME